MSNSYVPNLPEIFIMLYFLKYVEFRMKKTARDFRKGEESRKCCTGCEQNVLYKENVNFNSSWLWLIF